MVEYKNVTDLPIMDEATENTHVIVEDGGSFKLMSGDKLGGGGVKTAIIKPVWWEEAIDAMVSGVQDADVEEPEYVCTNMTFDEAYNTLAAGEPMVVLLASFYDYPAWEHGVAEFMGITADGEHRVIRLFFSVYDEIFYYWTDEYGITPDNPFRAPK